MNVHCFSKLGATLGIYLLWLWKHEWTLEKVLPWHKVGPFTNDSHCEDETSTAAQSQTTDFHEKRSHSPFHGIDFRHIRTIPMERSRDQGAYCTGYEGRHCFVICHLSDTIYPLPTLPVCERVKTKLILYTVMKDQDQMAPSASSSTNQNCFLDQSHNSAFPKEKRLPLFKCLNILGKVYWTVLVCPRYKNWTILRLTTLFFVSRNFHWQI